MADHTKQDEGERRVAIVSGSTRKPISNSRRRFLSNAGMFSAGLVGSTLLAACSDGDSNIAVAQDNQGDGDGLFNPAVRDEAVLQFALNLEYLEAEYYLRAVNNGMGLQQDQTSGQMTAGMVTPPRAGTVDFSGEDLIRRYANEIASDELQHVRFLRTGLETLDENFVIARPQINLRESFDGAATAALQLAGVLNDGSDGNPAQTTEFDPFASPLAFLIGAFIFEDVGVSAYQGGAQFIRNRNFLTSAAGILAVEGYHAGLVRTVLTVRASDPNPPMLTFPIFEQQSNGMSMQVGETDPIPLGTVVDAVSNARDFVDGEDDNDQGITDEEFTSVDIYGNELESTNIVPTDGNAITFPRTPGQVHNVVYLTPMAANSGGFFPEGTRIPAGPDGFTSSSDARMDDNEEMTGENG